MPMTQRVHGYSGTWNTQNRFELWAGESIAVGDGVYLNGKAFLFLDPSGRNGSGVQVGTVHISLGSYRAAYEVVNEIIRAEVDDDGALAMRLKVIRRHLIAEEGDAPTRQARRDLQNREFDLRVDRIDDIPMRLEGVHEYFRAGTLYQRASEMYSYLSIVGATGL
jgi:hypothetical protein